jgi:hypothetical protein
MSEFQHSKVILQQFVELQGQLIQALLSAFPGFSDLDHLTDFPQSTGTLEAIDTKWEFRKHGIGFTFNDSKKKTVVNAHKWLSNPEFFDAYRISSYLASIRWKGEKDTPAKERQILYSEKGTKEWFKQLANLGIIEPISNDKTHYRLKA